MNLKKAAEYQKRTGKVPVGTILASPEPLETNFVFLLSGFRFRVKKEISKDEFLKRHFAHLQEKDPAYGNMDVRDSKATIDETDAAFPSPDQKYFYEAELIR